ncbi:unnamed protein product, partial [Pleuronectes platessa]
RQPTPCSVGTSANRPLQSPAEAGGSPELLETLQGDLAKTEAQTPLIHEQFALLEKCEVPVKQAFPTPSSPPSPLLPLKLLQERGGPGSWDIPTKLCGRGKAVKIIFVMNRSHGTSKMPNGTSGSSTTLESMRRQAQGMFKKAHRLYGELKVSVRPAMSFTAPLITLKKIISPDPESAHRGDHRKAYATRAISGYQSCSAARNDEWLPGAEVHAVITPDQKWEREERGTGFRWRLGSLPPRAQAGFPGAAEPAHGAACQPMSTSGLPLAPLHSPCHKAQHSQRQRDSCPDRPSLCVVMLTGSPLCSMFVVTSCLQCLPESASPPVRFHTKRKLGKKGK